MWTVQTGSWCLPTPPAQTGPAALSQRCPKDPRKREYGLHPRAFRPARRWAVDNVDPAFVKTLDADTRAFLEQFNREYYGADSTSLNSPEALHSTPELRKSVFNMQNAANRCVYGRAAAFEGRLEGMPDDDGHTPRSRGIRQQALAMAVAAKLSNEGDANG